LVIVVRWLRVEWRTNIQYSFGRSDSKGEAEPCHKVNAPVEYMGPTRFMLRSDASGRNTAAQHGAIYLHIRGEIGYAGQWIESRWSLPVAHDAYTKIGQGRQLMYNRRGKVETVTFVWGVY
jgi:hypothetical protein